MKIVLKRQPQITLAAIASFTESKNTKGSGKRFILRFVKFIEKHALGNVIYSLCKHPVLADLNYCCIFYNKWVIAFTIENNITTIHTIIHGSVLK